MYRGDPTFVDANSLVPGDIISLEAQAARLFSRLRGLFCTMCSSRKCISDFEIHEQTRPVKVFTVLIVDICYSEFLERLIDTEENGRPPLSPSNLNTCMMTSTKMFSSELRAQCCMLQAGDKVPADVRIIKCTEGAEVLSFKFSTVRRNYVKGSIMT